MISLKFSTEDLTREDARHYNSFELKYEGMQDANIGEMLDIFETFLKARGYASYKLDYKVLKEVNDD